MQRSYTNQIHFQRGGIECIDGVGVTQIVESGLCHLWNPVDLYKIDMPEHLKEKQLAKAVKQAIRFLESQGLNVS